VDLDAAADEPLQLACTDEPPVEDVERQLDDVERISVQAPIDLFAFVDRYADLLDET
jgi:hypothetical protein